jgi:hypothetical protein
MSGCIQSSSKDCGARQENRPQCGRSPKDDTAPAAHRAEYELHVREFEASHPQYHTVRKAQSVQKH